ncbi:hypothetical protein U1Q18_014895, partial [Sarracenia purpurea var. burkii]
GNSNGYGADWGGYVVVYAGVERCTGRRGRLMRGLEGGGEGFVRDGRGYRLYEVYEDGLGVLHECWD